jgi:glycosyltransferase involved in cell wall biosynthesis
MEADKRILVICKNIPYPPHTGGDTRIFNLVKRLSENFRITLLCMTEEQSQAHANHLDNCCADIYLVPIVTQRDWRQKLLLFFQIRHWPRLLNRLGLFLKGYPLGNLVFYHPAFREKLREVLRRGDYDIVQFEFIVTAQYFYEVTDLLKSTKSIMVQHGMIADELSRMATYAGWLKKVFYRIEAARSRRFEERLLPRFDAVVAMSGLDKQELVEYGVRPNRVVVVRSGVDTETFRCNEISRLGSDLVFLGTMRYLPNKDGLTWFVEKIFPKIRIEVRDARLFVIGGIVPKVAAKYQSEFVDFLGVVENLGPAMANGGIFISPIRIGTGTRLKIVTAMAFGMPVVTTSVGIEGISKTGEEFGSLIADSETSFAEAVIGLCRDPERRVRIGSNARKFVEQEYSWTAIAQEMASLYDHLLRGSMTHGQ